MINCTNCEHWDSFEFHAVIWHRITGGFLDEPICEYVETCSKGLTPMDDGRTVSACVDRCERYIPRTNGGKHEA